MKNIRKRNDGRFEWRKMINNKKYNLINKSETQLKKEVRKFIKQIKTKITKETVIKINYEFKEIAWAWYRRYKENKIKSHKRYKSVLNSYFEKFTADIRTLTKDDLMDFLNDITEHRNAAYAYFIIKNVCADATEKNLIKQNIAINIKKPKDKGKKGCSFTLEEQKLIIKNIDKCPIKNEIMFYLLTGCRRSEAFNAKINFEKSNIFIDGTKTKTGAEKRYIKITKNFSDMLKQNFKNMFNKYPDYYTNTFKDYLTDLEIEDKTLHDLRHTFSTNLYYLGVNDKKRQYLLGHSSIVMTNDIYTHLDPTITKKDILNLYINLYPKF